MMMIDDFDTQVQSDELGEEIIEETEETVEAKNLYFEIPTQVRFLDMDGGDNGYYNGIAFQDFVICGCCGGVFELKELYDLAEEEGIPAEKVIILYDSWRDLNSLIEE